MDFEGLKTRGDLVLTTQHKLSSQGSASRKGRPTAVWLGCWESGKSRFSRQDIDKRKVHSGWGWGSRFREGDVDEVGTKIAMY